MKIATDAAFYFGQKTFADFLLSTQVGAPRWALLDEQGDFVDLKKAPKLAELQVSTDSEGLHLGLSKMFFKVMATSSSQRTVALDGHSLTARLEPDLYSQAISQFIAYPCRLIRF